MSLSSLAGTPSLNNINNPTTLDSRIKLKSKRPKIKIRTEKIDERLKKSKVLKKKWKIVRKAGGEVWEDPTLEEWPENDFRILKL